MNGNVYILHFTTKNKQIYIFVQLHSVTFILNVNTELQGYTSYIAARFFSFIENLMKMNGKSYFVGGRKDGGK